MFQDTSAYANCLVKEFGVLLRLSGTQLTIFSDRLIELSDGLCPIDHFSSIRFLESLNSKDTETLQSMGLNVFRYCTFLHKLNARVVQLGQILLLSHVVVVARDFLLIESKLIVVPDILIHLPFARFLFEPGLTVMSSEHSLGFFRDFRSYELLSFAMMVAEAARLRRNLKFASIWIELGRLQVEVPQHLIDLAGCKQVGKSETTLIAEDQGQLLVEAALIKQTLDAHFTHEAIRGLQPQPQLPPAAGLYRDALHVLVRPIQMLNVRAV